MSDQTDPFSDFLYPFLQNNEQISVDRVLSDVSHSTRQKATEVIDLRTAFLNEQGKSLINAAMDMATRFQRGGKLLAFGNGGSATDAQDIVADCMNPTEGERQLPAISLTNDAGIVTAIGNDVGFDNIYARQIIAYGKPEDIALGFSTSGESANLLAAFKEAQKRGLLTIAIVGYDGGKAQKAGLDHCLIVRSTYIPRIQEVQATIYHTLLLLVREQLKEVFS